MEEYIVTLHNKEDLDDFYNDMMILVRDSNGILVGQGIINNYSGDDFL
mgnify:CR=1 FL=1